MALSNAERQARYQQRLKERMGECVTPNDVERAVRLLYEHEMQFPENRLPPFDEWMADQRKQRAGGGWSQLLPSNLDPMDYDDFAPDDAALLLKVAKVVRAMRFPPAD